MSQLPFEVTPREVKDMLDAGDSVRLIDVREMGEHQLTRIDGAELIPMRGVPAALSKLEGLAEEGALIVFCHHGVRSMQVVNWLREQGVSDCQSMAGGIDRWSVDIDPALPRY